MSICRADFSPAQADAIDFLATRLQAPFAAVVRMILDLGLASPALPSRWLVDSGEGAVKDPGTISAKREVSVSISSPYSSEKKEEETASSAAPNEPSPADAGRAQAPTEPALLEFNCVKSKRSQQVTWPLTQTLLSDLEGTFADMDVLAEARKAKSWVDADSSRRKTHGGMKRFLTDWCIRGQNRGTYVRRAKSVATQATPREILAPGYIYWRKAWTAQNPLGKDCEENQWDPAHGPWPCTLSTWHYDEWGNPPENLLQFLPADPATPLSPPDQPGQSVGVSH